MRLQPHEEDRRIESGFSPGPYHKFLDQRCQQSGLRLLLLRLIFLMLEKWICLPMTSLCV